MDYYFYIFMMYIIVTRLALVVIFLGISFDERIQKCEGLHETFVKTMFLLEFVILCVLIDYIFNKGDGNND